MIRCAGRMGLFGWLCLSTPLSAQERLYSFECDTPEGRYSKVEIPIAPGTAEVSGEFRVNEVRSSTKWAPGVNVILHDVKPKSAAGLRAVILDADSQSVAFHVFGNEEGEKQEFGSLEWKDKVVPFKVKVASSGRAIVTAGNSSAEMETESKRVSFLTLGCSSGDFTFQNIQVTTWQ